ncbi:S41 family peptidase [Alteromonas sp. ASW11-36]|uniref:S41 family peptidase n=1 Tax=Alteromonas arenosi TaxID=3055817 RepID=A0ABT7SXP2_9ALTE|nr:S41 family peptidase [Alteromonas sp. ASW11-36]MDM7860964.1 S41 family peptidase [Alteromonas sp. ASW11-36]
MKCLDKYFHFNPNEVKSVLRTLYIIILALFLSSIHHQPARANTPELHLEHSEVLEIVQGISLAFDTHYIEPDKAKNVKQTLQSMLVTGDFDQAFEFYRLKTLLESTVIKITSDSNFKLVRRTNLSQQNAIDSEEHLSNAQTQVLEPNIGYIALSGDFVHDAREELVAALNQMSDTDALIIDIRDAGLGSVDLSQLIISYFNEPNTLLGHIYAGRKTPVPLVSYDISELQFQMPVFILTSSFVAGPWEFLAYTLKHLEKATIVGEDTIGLGMLTSPIPVSKHASVLISTGIIKLNATDDSWHRSGVIADYQTSADASFEHAYQLAQKLD